MNINLSKEHKLPPLHESATSRQIMNGISHAKRPVQASRETPLMTIKSQLHGLKTAAMRHPCSVHRHQVSRMSPRGLIYPTPAK